MALTTVPGAGQVLRGATLAALITEARTVGVIKTANETVNNSAAFQDDNELFVSLAASAVYLGKIIIYYNSGTTPDFKAQMSLPSGGAGQWGGAVYSLAGTLVTFGTNDITTGTSMGGLGSVVAAELDVRITTVSAGTATLRWAQNTANPSDTTVLAESAIWLNRIS